MRVLAGVVLGGCLLISGVSGISQVVQPTSDTSSHPQASVSFQFDRVGLEVPHFVLTFHEDGTGRYQAEQAARSATETSVRGEAAQHVDRSLTLSAATTAKIFAAAKGLNHFNVACASKAKNIADTGTKTLSYMGTDGTGSCVYNFTENKTVGMLTETFQGIAYTMDVGRKLEFLHRYDRLGLDAEMSSLVEESETGRALELGSIASTLAAIADDPALIQRARLRAAKLLEKAKESQ